MVGQQRTRTLNALIRISRRISLLLRVQLERFQPHTFRGKENSNVLEFSYVDEYSMSLQATLRIELH